MPHSTRARDELYSTPPQAFVRARNALAARLRQRGRAREAAEIARLRRPSVALWLGHRLAPTQPPTVPRRSAAADPSRHPDLRQGRLAEELEPGGFEVLGAMPTRHLTLVKPDGRREATRAARERQRLDIAERAQREATRRETLAQRRQAVKLEA